MRAIHARLEGFTASYPYPFLRSGTQLTLPCPPLSGIFGNLSACCGRPVAPPLSFGFEFHSDPDLSIDLERTRRLRMNPATGKLSDNPERGVAKRQFHFRPILDLYILGVELLPFLQSPVATPCLGRSQDIAWITLAQEIELEPAPSGVLRRTMVPFPNGQVGGRVLPPLADYFVNTVPGRTRRIGRLTRYQFVESPAAVVGHDGFALFHPSDRESQDHVIYLHSVSP